STIEVKVGDQVKQGQELGRSGTTGLAVGDHLHYEVLIQGVSVTPVEWWDGKWIRDHIGRPLQEANVPLLQSEFPESKAPASAGRHEEGQRPRCDRDSGVEVPAAGRSSRAITRSRRRCPRAGSPGP